VGQIFVHIFFNFHLIYQKIISLATFSHFADKYTDVRVHKCSKKSRVLPPPSCLQEAEMRQVSY